MVPAQSPTKPAAREPEWISGQLRPAGGDQRGHQRGGYTVEDIGGGGGGGQRPLQERPPAAPVLSLSISEK